MWALGFILLYGTFVVCVETLLESRAIERSRSRTARREHDS
jgi:hypothetical protein